MNILLINHYAGSPSLGMEFRPYYLSKEWMEQGHRVKVVAATFSHLRKSNRETNHLAHCENHEGVDFFWINTPSYEGNGFSRIKNIAHFVIKMFRLRRRIIKDFNPDIIIASSTYPFDIFPGYNLARMTNAKLVFEVHDLWPLSPLQLGGFSKMHPFIVLTQLAEDFAYKKADTVVSMLPKAKSYMVSRGLDPEKFLYIPNGFYEPEQSLIEKIPSEHQETIDHLKSNGKFLIGYAGGHSTSNALDILIDVAFLSQNENPNLVFVLVGKGIEKESLRSRVEGSNLKNVYFLDVVTKFAVQDFLSQMDVLFIGWSKNPLYKYGISPNKLIDYMLASKPIIHSVDAGNDIVKEANCGISVPTQDADAILGGIFALSNLADLERSALGQNGKSYVLNHHNYKNLSKEFLEFVQR